MVGGFQPIPWEGNKAPYKILFSPKDFILENGEIYIEQYRLDPEELREYGIQISLVREKIRANATRLDSSVWQNMSQEIVNVSKIA